MPITQIELETEAKINDINSKNFLYLCTGILSGVQRYLQHKSYFMSFVTSAASTQLSEWKRD